MDAGKFDQIARIFGRRLDRRGALAGLLSLLSAGDLEAAGKDRRDSNRNDRDEESREKSSGRPEPQKKKKKKKKGASCPVGQRECNGLCLNPDECCPICDPNSQCVADRCVTLGCDQSVLNGCLPSISDRLVSTRSTCTEPCRDNRSTECRDCITDWLADAANSPLLCYASACPSTTSALDSLPRTAATCSLSALNECISAIGDKYKEIIVNAWQDRWDRVEACLNNRNCGTLVHLLAQDLFMLEGPRGIAGALAECGRLYGCPTEVCHPQGLCCPQGEVPLGRECCSLERICGTSCCSSDEVCLNGHRCTPIDESCPAKTCGQMHPQCGVNIFAGCGTWITCGCGRDEYCDPETNSCKPSCAEGCTPGRCGEVCGQNCGHCPSGQTCNLSFVCECESGREMCHGQCCDGSVPCIEGVCRCPDGYNRCGNSCYNPLTDKCCSSQASHSCPLNTTCCSTSYGNTCCSDPTYCSWDGCLCANGGEFCPTQGDLGGECCPSSMYCSVFWSGVFCSPY